MDVTEIKSLLEQQGAAFDAFKKTHEELKNADALTAEKLGKIETALDAAVEAKSALEAKIAAEAKEREELELRIQRMGIKANSTEEAKAAIELKALNDVLAQNCAARNISFQPLDAQGAADYKAAFVNALRKPRDLLSPEEVKTLQVGSDPDGGYFVTPDTTGRIVKKVYESSPMRQLASVQMISTDALEGIEDLGEAGAGYAGEQAQGSDTTTPQVGKWRIPVYWIDTEPKTTQQLLDDAAVDVEAWLSGKVSDKFARFENAEFVAGSTGKIRGLTSYTTAADSGSGVTWGQIGYVATGANGDITNADKLIDLVGAVKAAYLNNGKFMTRRSVITKLRKLKDGQSNYLWQPSFQMGQPEQLMGYPLVRAEDMPALTTDSMSLAFGDFASAYQIVDRQGIRVLRDNLTSKPFVKFYTTKRVGGGVVNFEAVKLMKFGTS